MIYISANNGRHPVMLVRPSH